MSRHFFLYGTLRPDCATGLSSRLIAPLDFLGEATVAGKLFAKRDPRGVYPVLIAGGRERVRGVLAAMSAGAKPPPGWIHTLDEYEGAGREYLRRSVRCVGPDGQPVKAQAYVYARPTARGLQAIRHGDFRRFLEETGLRPFAG